MEKWICHRLELSQQQGDGDASRRNPDAVCGNRRKVKQGFLALKAPHGLEFLSVSTILPIF